MAQSGHTLVHCKCPLLGLKRTCRRRTTSPSPRLLWALDDIFERAPQRSFSLQAPLKGTLFVIDEITCSPPTLIRCLLLGESGHSLLRCECLLMTQSGQRAAPFQHASICR